MNLADGSEDVRIEKGRESSNAASNNDDNGNDNGITSKPSAPRLPMPPALPNPMQTTNLLSRLQTFLPQMEAANRGKMPTIFNLAYDFWLEAFCDSHSTPTLFVLHIKLLKQRQQLKERN